MSSPFRIQPNIPNWIIIIKSHTIETGPKLVRHENFAFVFVAIFGLEQGGVDEHRTARVRRREDSTLRWAKNAAAPE